MLRHLHGFEYTKATVIDIPEMILNVRIYGLADKYEISNLKCLAKARFESAARAGWSTIEFPLSIEIIYESTPLSDRCLRDIAVKVAVEHRRTLFVKDGAVFNAVSKISEFGRDVVDRLKPVQDIINLPPAVSSLYEPLDTSRQEIRLLRIEPLQ